MITSQIDGTSQSSEQRYRQLFENIPLCIFITDLTVSPVVILAVNRRAELIYGYKAVELVGSPATRLIPEAARINVQNILQRVKQGETVTTVTVAQHRDGTTFPVRIIATLDPTHSGRMITTVEDITAEMQRRSETEAIESERRRIAHEIHDGVAQNLGGLRFKSALWSYLADSAPPGMRAALDELQTVLTDSIADIRRAIFALRPVDLETLGFLPALTQLITDFGDHNQLLANLDTLGLQGALPASYELPLFRIVQEGLNNINHHAHASSVLVRLYTDTVDNVLLSLRDDGCGFDPGLIGPGHFGLRHMRERIQDLGGTLDICSGSGQGTELLVSLPPHPKEVNHAVG